MNALKAISGFYQHTLVGISDCAPFATDVGRTLRTRHPFRDAKACLCPASSIRFHDEQRCLFPKAQGAMGYAVPAILGAYFAGKSEIVTIVGDGSVMMNIQELQIIKSFNVLVKIFVINNNMYAIIRKRQRDLFRKRTIGNDPSDGVPAPSFKDIAECFGLKYKKIGNYSELVANLHDILNLHEPVLCEVICTPEQKYLHKARARNEKGHFVNYPLEDLSPFIDREKFQKELLFGKEGCK